MDIYGWADWKDWSNKIDNHQDNLTKLQFLSNSTWYRWDNEIRFLSIEDKKYTVNSIPYSTDVFLILDFCKSKRQFQEILNYFVTEQKLPEEEITENIRDLLDVELLLTDNNRSLTEREVPKQLNLENTTETSKQYIISSRNITQGNLPFGTIKVLKEYIHFISSVYPKKINNNLIEFRNYFQQRWENQAIPLSLVFDPFSGFSYGAELADQDEEFIKITDIIGEPEKQNTHRISSFEKFIFRETMNGREIKLENYQEDRIDPRICLPNTLSALVHVYNGSPVVHSIGGSSANSLIGRFTILPVFEKYGRAIAKLEEESNPEIMFFDLAYICEGKVDNINRRSPLYQVELPFANWSSFDQPLYLQDILVSIKNHTIILHHRPTGKRLIPRFASSYNYTRSELPYFRFLHDIQEQETLINLNLDLKSIIPGLDYYPRVSYKNCIISTKEWRCPKFSSMEDLTGWLNNFGPKDRFLVGNSDQTLLIDPRKNEDIFNLMIYCEKNDNIFLKEALISEEGAVSDILGKNYHAEFVIDFYHNKKIYDSMPLEESSMIEPDIRSFNSEWIYIEFYVNENISDVFILGEMKDFISSLKGKISQWFFIRYNNPKPHIRLRIKKKINEMGIYSEIGTFFSSSRKNGIIKEIILKEYVREIQRYGEETMDYVENFFCIDSNMSLKDILLNNNFRYSKIISTMESLTSTLFPRMDERITFYRTMANSFASEMGIGTTELKKINAKAKNLQIYPNSYVPKMMIRYLNKIMCNAPETKKLTILADLIHMHINRRFRSDQRLHEAIIYQIIYKKSLSMLHLNKKA